MLACDEPCAVEGAHDCPSDEGALDGVHDCSGDEGALDEAQDCATDEGALDGDQDGAGDEDALDGAHDCPADEGATGEGAAELPCETPGADEDSGCVVCEDSSGGETEDVA
jgi:hypothetical protein